MGAPSRICPLHHQVHRRRPRRLPSPSSSYRGRGSPREGRHDSRHRTSDPVRTSDIEGHEGGNRGQKLCIGRRTSDRLRTSEVSDVRQTTDVRNPHDREFANSSDVRWTSGVPTPRTSETQRTSDISCSRSPGLYRTPQARQLSDVRTLSDVRNLPACRDSWVTAHVFPSYPLDYKYLSPSFVLGLA